MKSSALARGLVAAACLGILLSCQSLKAQDKDPAKPASTEPKADVPATPADELQAIVDEYNNARAEFFAEYKKATTEDEQQKLIAEKLPNPDAYAPRFLEFSKKHGADPAAVDALLWIVTNCRGGKDLLAAGDTLVAKHLASEKMGSAIRSLINAHPAVAEKLLTGLAENGSTREIKAMAAYAFAKVTKDRVETVRTLKQEGSDGQMSQAYANAYGAEIVAQWKASDPADMEKHAESLFEKVQAEFAEVSFGSGTLGKLVERELFEMRNLSVGKVAPEIDGEDIAGDPLKLTGFRGKVVLLDFWGDW